MTSIAPAVEADTLSLAKRKPPEDMQAYDHCLKAFALVEEAASAAALKEARDYCDRAILLDPSYARAYACKTRSYLHGIVITDAGDAQEWRTLALGCAERAIALDPSDAVNHRALAEATFYLKQSDRCRAHMARALQLNPNDADSLATFCFFETACGYPELGLRYMEMARERNPSHPVWYDWMRGGTLYLMGRYDEALTAFDLYSRNSPGTLRWRAATLVQLGRTDEAREEMKMLLALRPGLTADAVRKHFYHLPIIDSYIDALRQAGLPE